MSKGVNMTNKNKMLENKEHYCSVCNDSGVMVVMDSFGQKEMEPCLCTVELSFFHLHGIE